MGMGETSVPPFRELTQGLTLPVHPPSVFPATLSSFPTSNQYHQALHSGHKGLLSVGFWWLFTLCQACKIGSCISQASLP